MRHLLLVVSLALVVGCDAGAGDPGPPDVGSPGQAAQSPGAAEADSSAFTSVWHGPDGQPAERGAGQGYSFEVHASDGPPHCEWDPAVFLSVGWPLGTTPDTAADMHQYLRDPDGAVRVPDEVLLGELDMDAEMPAGATDTGYGTAEAELWFGPDGGDRYAYLKTSAGVERWPRAREAIACA